MPRIVVVGSLNMDLLVRAPRHPARGETVMGDGLLIMPGGKGLNQAVAAARLGAAVEMEGRVGDDDFGRRFLAFLDSERITRDGVSTSTSAPTGVGIVTIAGGDNAIVVAPGANMELSPALAAAARFAPGDICLGQFEVPLETTAAAFARARDAGATTILNAAPARALPEGLLALVDTLIVNETELAALSGAAVTGDSATAEIASAARRLANGRRVVATLGARGALVVDHDGVREFPARRVEVVDPTGAGDCFVGALAAGLAAGLESGAALTRANAAAALSVTRPGAAPAMPVAAELDRFMAATA